MGFPELLPPLEPHLLSSDGVRGPAPRLPHFFLMTSLSNWRLPTTLVSVCQGWWSGHRGIQPPSAISLWAVSSPLRLHWTLVLLSPSPFTDWVLCSLSLLPQVAHTATPRWWTQLSSLLHADGLSLSISTAHSRERESVVPSTPSYDQWSGHKIPRPAPFPRELGWA